MDRTIALVGLPASGKSFLGVRLAARLALPFADTDLEAEAAARRTIPAIFAAEGEAGFRARERLAIASALEGVRKVVALGGGGFEDRATRARLLEVALVIWLDAPDAVLAARIGEGGGRPLFAGTPVPTVLRRLRQERSPHFAQAHHRLDTSGGEALEALVMLIGRGAREAAPRPSAPPRR